MTVDIRFYKTDTTPISLDKTTGGVDFGIVKKNQQAIVPVVIKNLGTSDANNIIVTSSQLHNSSEISPGEYANETYAKSWKTFSMLQDGTYTSTLNLPNIKAGQTMLGIKKYNELFTNPANSAWKNDTLAGHIFNWTGNSVKVTPASGVNTIWARMSADGWGTNKEIDFTVQFVQPASTTAGSSFTMFCLRQNANGDEKGYLINVKRLTTAVNSGTVTFEIRKGAGIKVNGTNDFGTTLSSSTSSPWFDFVKIRIKLFTNANNLPEIKIWVNNIKDTDPSVIWGGVGGSSSWVDTLNTYSVAGKVTAIFGSGGTNYVGANEYEIRSANLITDDLEGKVYIKTSVGDGAVDAVVFNSAMELFYDGV